MQGIMRPVLVERRVTEMQDHLLLAVEEEMVVQAVHLVFLDLVILAKEDEVLT
jgi:hypothetical protein